MRRAFLVLLLLAASGCGDNGPEAPSLTGGWRGFTSDQSVLWTLNLADNDGNVIGCAEAQHSAASGFGTVRYQVSGTHAPPQVSLNLTPILTGFSVRPDVALTAQATQDMMTATVGGQPAQLARHGGISLQC